MAKKYILAVDQSTSGTKASLISGELTIDYQVSVAHSQHYPKPGWVEHDPEEIWQNVRKVILKVVQEGNVSWSEIAAIAVTNQRETGLIWDSETGKPVYNAIVWQCSRAKEQCGQLAKDNEIAEYIRKKTGLHLSPYFTAPKIQWILNNITGLKEKASTGRLKFGTVDSWIIWNLTGGKVHATDYSNASRTLLLDLEKLRWDQKLLDIFEIPCQMTPEIKPSDSIFGYTAGDSDIPDGIPISGVMGDSHAALFGQNCFSIGMTKATYGTGSSVMMNTGSKPVFSDNGIVTSIGWITSEDKVYVLEGNINFSGRTIQWLVDAGFISSPKETGEIASKLSDNGGVYLVPAFTGLGSPYWDNSAKATVTGLTLTSKTAHIVRAAEESIVYQITDILDIMQIDSGIKIAELRVDGGATGDSFLMQFQSDIANTKVVISKEKELTSLGSACMAGLATGFWKNRGELEQRRSVSAVYTPQIDEDKRTMYKKGWQDAVSRALSYK